MRTFTFKFLGALSLLFSASQLWAQPTGNSFTTSGAEQLINEYDRICICDHQIPEDQAPIITFQAYINRQSTVKDLARIQEKAAKRLGIVISYTRIEYDSIGLRSIWIQARTSDSHCLSGSGLNLTNKYDFGIFEVTYGTIRQCFIGSRTSWPERLHSVIAKRS